jgi:hypothetical protein
MQNKPSVEETEAVPRGHDPRAMRVPSNVVGSSCKIERLPLTNLTGLS